MFAPTVPPTSWVGCQCIEQIEILMSLTCPKVDCHPMAAARLEGFRTLVPSQEPTAGAYQMNQSCLFISQQDGHTCILYPATTKNKAK